jgi:transcriptional regulator with XRE-family HTH domain
MTDNIAKVKRGRQARNKGMSQVANLHIGERIRIRRTLAGMSQSGLGKSVGLSFQQIQKYESGTSVIGAGQLCQFAEALDVPISFFYDGLDGVSLSLNSNAETQKDPFDRHEIEMLRHYRAVPDYLRDAVHSLLGQLSNQDIKHNRNVVEEPSAEQESLFTVSPAADGPERITTNDGTDIHSMKNEVPDLDAGVEPKQRATVEMPGSVPPAIDQPCSATQEPQAPVKRGRGRPRKDANPYTAKPVDEATAVRSRAGVGEVSAASSETTAPKPRRRRGAVWDPKDAGTSVEEAGRSLPASNLSKPVFNGGNNQKNDRGTKPGARRNATRAASGNAIWTPADIKK